MFEQENHECSRYDDECKELIEKFLTICLPVKITPHVEVKPVKTECCGKAIITPKHGNCCKMSENGSCEFTIIQKMKIEIPVEFKAKTDIDDPFVDCEFRRDEDDKHCGKDHDKCCDKDHDKDHDKCCEKEHDKDHDKCCEKEHDKDYDKCCEKEHDKDRCEYRF